MNTHHQEPIQKPDGEFLVCAGPIQVAQFSRWREAYCFANKLAGSRPASVRIIALSSTRTLLSFG